VKRAAKVAVLDDNDGPRTDRKKQQQQQHQLYDDAGAANHADQIQLR